MHTVLRLPWARQIYDYRKTQGERPFAEIKQTMRFRRFLASWTRQHPGRMEPGVRGCERPDHLQSGNGMRKDPTGDHEPGWKPGPGRSQHQPSR